MKHSQARGLKGLAMISASLFALMSGQAAAAAEDSPQEVIVTAQKRSERLQEVPLSVAVVSADTLSRQHISQVEDLQMVAPSVSFTTSTSTRGQGLSIRGIGTLSFSDGVEPSVSTVVDGVVLGRQAMSVFDLIDVDRVEILRGPQGTLFGKNASAGVLSIVTQKPSKHFGGAYSASYGEMGETKLQGSVTGPVLDKLSARFTAYSNTSDGYVKNPSTGADFNGKNQQGARAKFLFMPNDSLDIQAIVDYGKVSEDCCAPTIRSVTANNTYFGHPYSYYVGGTPSADNEITAATAPTHLEQDSWGASIEANQALNGFTLTSITAYRQFHVKDNNDPDLTALNLLDLNNADQHQSQISQELRIASPEGQRLEYVAGAFYLFQGLKTQTQSAGTFGAVPAPLFLGSQVNRGVHTANSALFGQATFHATDRLSLIGGLRYTSEDINAYFRRVPLKGALAAAPASVAGGLLLAEGLGSTESKLSYRFGLQYQVNPDLMTYATYSRGFKGAALNMLNFLTAAQVSSGAYLVKPEIPTNYEVGFRAAFMDRRLQLNGTAFRETFKGFQATAYDAISGSNTLTSAGELRSQGFELEALATPVRNLNLQANIAYTDATFTDFPNGPCYPGQRATAGSNCVAVGSTYVQNLHGATLNNAPKWAFNVGGNYSHPTGWNNWDGFIGVHYAYRGDVNFSISQDPNTVQSAYGVVNADTGLQTTDGKVRVSLFAKNLLDEHYAALIYASSFQAGNVTTPAGYSQFFSLAARRIVGVSLSGKF